MRAIRRPTRLRSVIRLTRRQALRAAATLGSFAIAGRARAAKPFTPSGSLVEAARREGKIVLYTATFVEVEQEVVNEFRKRFPFKDGKRPEVI